MEFKTKGVCASKIHVDVKDGIVTSVKFDGGCNGNLKGIGSLVEGMEVNRAIKKLEGIRCGMKSTSCPDQLAQSLKSFN